MPFWFFRKKASEPLEPSALQKKLIDAAATGSHRTLRKCCRQYKDQLKQHLESVAKVPESLQRDEAAVDRFVQCLIAVAECLAKECKSPELWNKITRTWGDNPMIEFDRWLEELPKRMQQLEFDVLIDEARNLIEQAKSFRGATARQFESFFIGRLGELLFHCGRVGEAIGHFQSAFALCEKNRDLEGQFTYLNFLLESHLYLDDGLAAQVMEELIRLKRGQGVRCDDLEKRLQRIRNREPLCRVVCVHSGPEMELDEIQSFGEGRYQFRFRRNRFPLQMATILVEQGKDLASSGNLSDALEHFYEASEIDPYDPDPVYQAANCLLELGAYGKEREAFEEVENLAPGWFRCRSDRWLASRLESGSVSDEEFRLIRALEDGQLKANQATEIAQKAIQTFPDFSPFYLIRGNQYHDRGELDQAASVYRRGLELVEEPDLESRLLCALAAVMPAKSEERNALLKRILELPGSLVAQATARLLMLQQTKM